MQAADGAFHGFDVDLELAPPSGHRLRLVLGWLRSAAGGACPRRWSSDLAFPAVSLVARVIVDHLVSGVAGFEPFPFGGHFRARAWRWTRRSGRVGLGRRRTWRVRRLRPARRAATGCMSGGALAWARSPSRIRASSPPRFRPRMMSASSPYFQGADRGGRRFRVLGRYQVRAGGYGPLRVGDPGGFPVGGGGAARRASSSRNAGGVGRQDAELPGQPRLRAVASQFAERASRLVSPPANSRARAGALVGVR